MSFVLAIVGRPNVGKSTLFNRLVGKKLALVDDQPGVTRDRREGAGRLGDLTFTVFDTAGLEDVDDDSLEARMRRQTERAVADADVCLFVIDARAGLTEADRHFASLLRKSRTPVLLAANKSEGNAGRDGLMEAYELGLGDPLPISAEHGEGMSDLYDALRPFYTEPESEEDDDTPEDERPLHLAVVGRPNVGKSTLINSFLGEDRMLTGPEAGVTRDSISVPFLFDGKPVRLVDTAGVRRRARVEEKLEKLSVADTLRAIRYAEVCVLTIDATLGMEKQDLNLASLIAEEGRALIIALNKWDVVDKRDVALRQAQDRLLTSMPQLRGVPMVAVSGLTGKNLDRLMQAAYEIRRKWSFRASTAKVNRWLESALSAHPPPLVSGRRIKIRYATQIKSRPPTFALFTAKADDLPDHYVRYLINSLRDTFDLDGPPIRMLLRKTHNPYAEDDGR